MRQMTRAEHEFLIQRLTGQFQVIHALLEAQPCPSAPNNVILTASESILRMAAADMQATLVEITR